MVKPLRQPDRKRQIKAALQFWELSLKPFSRKERHDEDETQDRRTAAAACPQRPSESEDEGNSEDKTPLGTGG